MKTSSGAVRLGNTLYRIQEVAWLKVQRLTLWEKLANALLVISGVLFLNSIHAAKSTWWSLEALLGLLPVCLGLAIHGDSRLASSGDTQDSYFGRGLGIDVNIKDLARPLREFGQNFLEITGAGNAYYYLINTDRIAWVSSWFTLNTWPLLMGLLFAGYNWVLGQVLNHGLEMPTLPGPLNNLHILHYAGPETVKALRFSTFMCALSGALALIASIKQGVILGSIGGVADTLHMYRSDRDRLLDVVAGPTTGAPVIPSGPPSMVPMPPPPMAPPPVESRGVTS